ncbi:hypothetical protein RHMOL_Rhmol06G0051300 [Rhododendron molle]|uniref:Uncharacterized protein n=1 Tax=Rhododendron molle TaxID=49168 RepID=A0ACC0N8Z0_RHOML|nr:hypothetical protein RHMOL_Rhmol06G0051300 [Rhododendron molle]
MEVEICSIEIQSEPSIADRAVLRTFELSDYASDGLDLISTINDRESFIAEMRSEPLDTRSDDSKHFLNFGLVLCNRAVLRTFELSDCASDGSDIISTINDRESFIAEMRSEPLDTRSDDSEHFLNFGLVLCSRAVLRTFEPSDCAFDGSDLISTINDRESFIAEMRSEPSDTRSNDSKATNTVLRIPLHTAPSPTPHFSSKFQPPNNNFLYPFHNNEYSSTTKSTLFLDPPPNPDFGSLIF